MKTYTFSKMWSCRDLSVKGSNIYLIKSRSRFKEVMIIVFSLSKSELNQLKGIFNFDFPNTIIEAYFKSNIGMAWVDDYNNPTACQVIVGDYGFLCGNPDTETAIELVGNIPDDYMSSVLVTLTDSEKWDKLLLDYYGKRAKVSTRYSTTLNVAEVNREQLSAFINRLPEQYRMVQIDKEIYQLTKAEKWSSDLCAQFKSSDDFVQRGIGYAVLLQDELVAGASSYLEYTGHIEIELQTKQEHRHRGLALSCSAMLVNECLKNSVYPNWDAANKESLHIAQKLGYCLKSPYKVTILSIRR